MGLFDIFGKKTTREDAKLSVAKDSKLFETQQLELYTEKVRNEFPRLRKGDKGDIKLDKENMELLHQIANNKQFFEWFQHNGDKIARTKNHAENEMKDELGNFRRAISADIIDPSKYEGVYEDLLRISEKMQFHGKRFTLAMKLFVNMYMQGLYKAVVEYNDAEQLEGESTFSDETANVISIDEAVDAKVETITSIANKINEVFVLHDFKSDFEELKEFPEKLYREFELLWAGLIDIDSEMKHNIKQMYHKAKKLKLEAAKNMKEMQRKLGRNFKETASAGTWWYANIKDNHPFMCMAVTTVLLLAGTVGAIGAIIGVSGGIIGFLGGGAFALVSGLVFAFATDYGVTIVQKVRGT